MSNIEDGVNKEFLFVLDQIQELRLKTKSGEPLKYWVTYFVGGDHPSGESEISILENLEQRGAIKIINKGGTGEYE